MSQTTQRPRTQRPKTKRPKTKKPKKKQQRPKKVQPTYVAITRPIPVPQTTRRTPAVSSTLSPETLMMEEMRNYLADNMPANRRPTVQKPRAQKPRAQKPRPQKPRPMVMNPVTLRTPTRRIPMEPYTQSPATKNMIEMRKVIMESGMRPIPRPEDSLGILDLFPDSILTTTPRSEVTTTTTRSIRFPQDNNPRQRIYSARQIGTSISNCGRICLKVDNQST